MKKIRYTITLVTAISFMDIMFLVQPLIAEEYINDDLIVDGRGCMGWGCRSEESFGSEELKLKDGSLRIKFEDTSTSGLPSNDWQITVNDSSYGGENYFSIEDIDHLTTPFTIKAGASNDSLYVDEAGLIGIGTKNPISELHICSLSTPSILLELDDTFFSPQMWELGGNDELFYVTDNTNSKIPFSIGTGTPNHTLRLVSSGNVGIGTPIPSAPLELSGTDSFNFFRITATGAPTNTSVDFVFTQGPSGTGELRYNIVDGDGPEMRLNADGDMILDGTLTTVGPICAGGCDRVFDEDYELRSIDEHAHLMWRDRYLPAVGPTEAGMPVNLTEKMGDMFNELEHAHIYIEQLNKKIKLLETLNSTLEDKIKELQCMNTEKIKDIENRLAKIES